MIMLLIGLLLGIILAYSAAGVFIKQIYDSIVAETPVS